MTLRERSIDDFGPERGDDMVDGGKEFERRGLLGLIVAKALLISLRS